MRGEKGWKGKGEGREEERRGEVWGEARRGSASAMCKTDATPN